MLGGSVHHTIWNQTSSRVYVCSSCITHHITSTIVFLGGHPNTSLGENLIASRLDRGNSVFFGPGFMLSFGRIYSLLFQVPKTGSKETYVRDDFDDLARQERLVTPHQGQDAKESI